MMRLMLDVERVISRLLAFECDWDDMIWSNFLVSTAWYCTALYDTLHGKVASEMILDQCLLFERR
jgi:hypothetical protein